jgi:hypothetical protein
VVSAFFGCPSDEDSLQQFAALFLLSSFFVVASCTKIFWAWAFCSPTVFLLLADFMDAEDKLRTFRNKTVHPVRSRPSGIKFHVAL